MWGWHPIHQRASESPLEVRSDSAIVDLNVVSYNQFLPSTESVMLYL